jgi:CRISPR-associated protein Csb2
MAPRPYISFELRQTDDRWATFRQVDTSKVAAMLRHVACEAAKGDSHKFPGGSERYVAGHASDRNDLSPRFSYLPLPTVGHWHADGMIRRMFVAEPYGSDGTQVRWAAQRLRNRTLVNDNGKEQALLLNLESEDPVVRAYQGPARTWSSVTPVVLPGLPVEAIKDVALRKAPFWPGSQHPRLYHRPAYLRDLPAWHVHIRLSESIHGPLAMGAGRYCGLGLFVRDGDD